MENEKQEKGDVLTPIVVATLITIALIGFNIYSYINNNDYLSISEDGEVYIYIISAVLTFIFLSFIYNARSEGSKNKDKGIGGYVIAGLIIFPSLAALIIETPKASEIIGVVVTSAIVIIAYIGFLTMIIKSSD